MLTDLPGVLTPFSQVQSGQCFIHFVGGAVALGMKVYATNPPNVIAVLSLGDRPHPSVTGPSIVEATHFDNRDVAVIWDAIVRPVYDLSALHDGSPRLDNYGAIIFVASTVLIRAFSRKGPVDVDLSSGAAQPARSHPGSMWVDHWEIVLPRPSGPVKLLEREV